MKENTVLEACESPRMPLSYQTNPPDCILLVEDDVQMRQINTTALLRAGYAVVAVKDGGAAWDALSTDTFDLMITDNRMPKLTGIEVLKKLRAARMSMPVIMATGVVPHEEFARRPWLLPTATLVKPYTLAELLSTVKRVLREAVSTPLSPRDLSTESIHRILVVDQDRDTRQLYTESLAGPGCIVDWAADGAAGWEALQANHYDLLLTEYDLTKMTGIELVTKVRAAHMVMPVIMATGRLPAHELERNPSLDLAAIIMKPFVVDALRDTVRNILRPTDQPDGEITPAPDWQSPPKPSDPGSF